jgi:methionyl-tRNA synthetase
MAKKTVSKVEKFVTGDKKVVSKAIVASKKISANGSEKFYITTAIPYVNAAPHVGFAMEIVQADVLARYHRLRGDEVYFLTGVDEHGVKLYETAKAAGKDTQAFADENAEKFKALKGILNLSNDGFIRTTSDYHKKGAQKLWKHLAEKGDIYKGKYKGLYCSGCEAFILEKDLVDGKCPNHDRAPSVVEEENYFFKLSKYSDKIKEVISSDVLKILPVSRKHEMLNLIAGSGGAIVSGGGSGSSGGTVSGGLPDVSFSRPKDVLPWGISVPDDPTQVMYVWGDALSNYITALGYGDVPGAAKGGKLFEKFWPCDMHVIGKDILRFHAGVWIGMLLSAGVPLPKAVCVHGFVTSEGKKMSKSLGNVVDPLQYVDEFGADALRFYLLREIPTGDDGDFSRGRFIEIYNSELANSFGNFVNRVLMMAERYLDGKISGKEKNPDFSEKIEKFWKKYEEGMNEFNMKISMEVAVSLLSFGNKYVEEQKPWELAKVDKKALAAVLYNLLEIVRNAALMLWPVMPGKILEVFECLGLVGEIGCQVMGGSRAGGGSVQSGGLDGGVGGGSVCGVSVDKAGGSCVDGKSGVVVGDLVESDIGAKCGYGKYFGFLKEGSCIKKGEVLFPRIGL